jgi:3-methyladenine DNA glycosylase AlkC
MPFADELIGPPTAHALAQAIHAAAPTVPLTALRAAPEALGPLSLRERSDLLRDALLADLPGDYASFATTIRAAQRGEATFRGWLIWPVTSAIALKAIREGTDGAFDDAMVMLAELTSRLTSEFALRALLDHDIERALPAVRRWTASDDVDVRRLASEGTRAFLPWARRVPALLADPRATLPIIDTLYRDDSEYVRRSVANHLNDLSRNHPDIVVETAAAWLRSPDENTARLVRHGLRTLVKRGDPGALALLGFAPAADIVVDGPTLDSATVPFGGSVGFRAAVTNTGPGPARLAIDYIVHHTKANGAQAGKTFKLTTATLEAGEHLDLRREHSFRPVTVRRYYPGPHAIELQVNGAVRGRADFDVLPVVGRETTGSEPFGG